MALLTIRYSLLARSVLAADHHCRFLGAATQFLAMTHHAVLDVGDARLPMLGHRLPRKFVVLRAAFVRLAAVNELRDGYLSFLRELFEESCIGRLPEPL